jgi:hypothetical protein
VPCTCMHTHMCSPPRAETQSDRQMMALVAGREAYTDGNAP